jgi:hypothetical protein
MKKTNKLFEQYFKLLNEQEPGEDPNAAAMAEPPAAQPPVAAPQESGMPENQKYMIKILTHAFIFNPTLFSRETQQTIANDIQRLSKSVNVPISKIVADITSIICLDNSLCRELKNNQPSLKTESKTIKFINKLMVLLEQPADATEPQQDTQEQPTAPVEGEAPVPAKKSELSLEEIFPLYKELILKALAHKPTDEELMMLKPVVDEFTEVDPTKIENFIAKTLNQSLEDNELEDNLEELDSPTEEPEIDLNDV